jgi:RNA polymerase sigma-70 factor (ECF subfamily)
MASSLDNNRLLERARGGDAEAVDELLITNRRRLRAMVEMRMDPRLAPRVDPSDVVQETLLEAHRRLPEYFKEQPIPFYPWLRQLAWEKLVRLTQRHLAAQKRSVRREEPLGPLLTDDSVAMLAKRLVSTGAGPYRHVARAELRARVREALKELSNGDREVLVLRYMEQLSVEEICAVLEIGASAVKMRHLRALERMRTLLEASGK